MHTIVVRNLDDCKELKITGQKRIAILGVSGSGKTTLAKKLAEKLQISHIELDELYLNKNWRESSIEEFRSKVENKITGKEEYIIDGNYSKVSDLTWDNCNILICLDYSKPIIMKRILKRTIKRVITQEELWNGNKESFSKSFLSKDSIILWSWNTYKKRKNQFEELKDKYHNWNKTMFIIKNDKALKMIMN